MAFVSFDEFLKHVASVDLNGYGQSHLAMHATDGGHSEFEAMRRHILGLYRGVKVAHSFVTADGHHVDCIPIGQQTTLRHSALKGHVIETEPAPSPAPAPPPP